MSNSSDQPIPGAGLRARVLASAGWQIATRLAQRSIGIASLLILARLLTPEDFGTVAIAMLVVYFAESFSNAGSVHYIQQVEKLDQRVLGTAWTLDILLKSLFAVGIWVFLPQLPEKFSDGTPAQVIQILALGLPLRSLFNPQIHVERRELRYERVFRLKLTQQLTGFVIAVTLAVITRSVWAIVFANLLSIFVAVLLSHRWFARAPKFTLVNLKKQLSFSSWMLARGVTGYMRATVDTFLVASYFSLDQLGRYNLAREITILPATEIVQPALEPLVPAFARANEKGESISQQVMLSLLTLVSIVAPMGVFIYLFSEPAVEFLLGERWLGTELLMAALVPLLVAFTLAGLISNLLLGIGKVRQLFAFDLVSLVLTVVVMTSLAGVALAEFAFIRGGIALVVTVPMLFYCLKNIGVRKANSLMLVCAPWCFAVLASVPIAIIESKLSVGAWRIIPVGICYVLSYAFVLLNALYLLKKTHTVWAEAHKSIWILLSRSIAFIPMRR